MFTTWRHSGVLYLFVKNPGEGYFIIDTEANNYGSWRDVETFKKQLKKHGRESQILGKARMYCGPIN